MSGAGVFVDSRVYMRVYLQQSEVDMLRAVLDSACDRMCLLDPIERCSLREAITMVSHVPRRWRSHGGFYER